MWHLGLFVQLSVNTSHLLAVYFYGLGRFLVLQCQIKVALSGHGALRQLRQIRRLVPSATLQMLVVALVHSLLDYGNGVAYWLAYRLT